MPTKRRLQQVQDEINKMPSLSTTVVKVLDICNQTAPSPHDLNRVISLDPVLTGKVLRLVNSAYYGISQRISSLVRAIIMLGVNTVKNLVLATSVMASARSAGLCRSFSMDDFWSHCLAVAVAAKLIAVAKQVPAAQRDEFFVAGLLHDLGKIPMALRFGSEYEQVLSQSRDRRQEVYACEENILGFNHCHVGHMVADKWNLSAGIESALAGHHRPDQAPVAHRQMVGIVALANQIGLALSSGLMGFEQLNPTVIDLCLEITQLTPDDLEHLRISMEQEVENAKVFLQLD